MANSKIVLDLTPETKQIYDTIREEGNKDKWFEIAGNVRNGKNVTTKTVLDASFASVLVKPLRIAPFALHYWGKSSTGKTVAMGLATSVWANPNHNEYWDLFNGTLAYFENKCGFLRDLPMMIDCIYSTDSKETNAAVDFIRHFSNGKTRKEYKDKKVADQKTWSNIVISNGEVPVANGFNENILQLHVNEQMFADARHTWLDITSNYGFAGKMFVEALQSSDDVKHEAKKLFEDYGMELMNMGCESARRAGMMSLILTADKLVAEYIFHDDNNLSARELLSAVDVQGR